MRYEKSFDVRDRVRVKLNKFKGKLDKSSTPSGPELVLIYLFLVESDAAP